MKIIVKGLNSIPIFFFNSNNHNKYKTFITQEMPYNLFMSLKKRWLIKKNLSYLTIHLHEQAVISDHVKQNLQMILL